MRYTTLIDLTEIKVLYRNINARLVYLHMALKAGYHDTDRDLLEMSIRRLADEVGLSVSATRHALEQLAKYQLVKRDGTTWTVRKWLPEQSITSRPKTARQQRALDLAAERAREQQQRDAEEAAERARRQAAWAEGKTSFMLAYEAKYRLAVAGDPQAQDYCRRHKEAYDEQCKAMQKNANKGIK